MLEGVRLRLSKFAHEEARIVDLSSKGARPSPADAFILFPWQPQQLAEKVSLDESLIIRLNTFSLGRMKDVCSPESTACYGGDACLFDFPGEIDGRNEIEVLRTLERYVREAHLLGLPFLCRLFSSPDVNASIMKERLSLRASLAQELGVDGILFDFPGGGSKIKKVTGDVTVYVNVGPGTYQRV